MKSFTQFLRDIKENIVNTAGSGNVAGIGVGPQGEPGGRRAIMFKGVKKRDPNWQAMQSIRSSGAGGKHKDQKRAFKQGYQKHKGREGM